MEEPFRTVSTVLVGAAIGGGAVLLGQYFRFERQHSRYERSGEEKRLLPVAMCGGHVRLSRNDDKTKIVVNPEYVCLALTRELIWDTAEPAGIKIEFKEEYGKKGPFLPDSTNPHYISEGVYERRMNDTRPIRSNPAGRIGDGPWSYTITWTPATGSGGNPITYDPAVCVRD